MEDNKNLERIADSLERIVELMEDEDQRRRRKTINEMNEARKLKRKKIKDKKQTKVNPDKIIKSSPAKNKYN